MNDILKAVLDFVLEYFCDTPPTPTSAPSLFKYPPLAPVRFSEALSPNFSRPAQARPIKYLIVHATESTCGSAVNTFGNAVNKVSAHYIIDKDGSVIRIVDDSDIAWHCGISSWKGDLSLNTKSIGIELVNFNDGKDTYPDAQIQVLMGMAVSLCKQYQISQDFVLRHEDIAPGRKTDPGTLFPWESFKCELTKHLA